MQPNIVKFELRDRMEVKKKSLHKEIKSEALFKKWANFGEHTPRLVCGHPNQSCKAPKNNARKASQQLCSCLCSCCFL